MKALTLGWRTAVVCTVVWILALSGAAMAEDVRVDVVINGHQIEKGAIIYGDRSYVALEDVASVLGGRFVYDSHINVAFVLTGGYVNLMADVLAERNPDVNGYAPIGPFVSGRGIPYGMAQPHLTVSFIPSGLVTAFVQIFTEPAYGHHVWFDQPREQIERFMAGDGYSQHLYVVDRSLLRQDDVPRVAFNGKALNLSPAALLVRDGKLYANLRMLAEASGGGVGWDIARRVASAKIVPGDDLTWSTLATLNGRIFRYYTEETDFVPSIGYRHSPAGPGLIVGVDGNERVAVVGAVFGPGPLTWFPWYDQSLGDLKEFPHMGKGYSQHIYLMDKEDIGY